MLRLNGGWGDWERIGSGVFRRRLPGFDETVGAVDAGDGGVLLVDAGPSLDAGAALGREVREGLGLPVRRVVLTHPHFDHVLGAGAFPGAEVYGAAGLAAHLAGEGGAGLAADAARHGLDRARALAGVRALARLRVTEVAGELAPAGTAGRVLLADVGPGHTAHDLAVVVGGSPPVVFCGDLVEESGEPQAGQDAHLARWPAALDRLLALGGPHARYVPGHGAVVESAFVAAQRRELARRAGMVD